jgi:hypothetical protein
MIRVFPSKTNATPDDDNAFINVIPDADEIHISVTFSWDKPKADGLAAEAIKRGIKTHLGGVAYGDRGGDFVPGRFLKIGYVITSRGCPNHCWFCDAWKREGNTIRELPITNGWDVLDSNLLACSEPHIRGVFEMLRRQPKKPKFTGGLDPKLMKPWIAEELKKLKPDAIYTAYDTPDDLEPIMEMGKMMIAAGFTRASKKMHCYVLCGFPKDTEDKAVMRLRQAWQAGFLPRAMWWKDANFFDWSKFCRKWYRPAAISELLKGEYE